MRNGFSRGQLPLIALAVALSLLLLSTSSARSEVEASVDSWEMRVCADPDALPFSNRAEQGFENRIAAIIADELGATLTYDWYHQGPDMITFRLRAGECDMIVGVPDGADGLLTTITYYRSPYVFVYRADSDFDVDSFDDEVLHDLEIAVQNVGIPPHEALVDRGLGVNIVNDYLEGEPHVGLGRSRAVIEAVVDGDVDIAVAWGPVAGYFGRSAGDELVIKPVQPQFEPPLLIQSFPMTMAVRVGDEALRDLLDVAIANRWEEIQRTLAEYSVPVQQIPRPRLGTRQEERTTLAFITPTLTGQSAIPESLYEVVGEAARNGALLAEGSLGTNRRGEEPVDVLTSSAPTAAAAVRAAERMALRNDVSGFVGGLGAGQAEAIARVAEREGVPFLNIGSPFMARGCSENTFHIAASSGMYLDAIATWHSSLGQQDWFVVQQEGEVWSSVGDRALAALSEHAPGSEIVGTVKVPDGKPSYRQELQEIRESDADVILLLLGPRDQIAFLAQQASAGVTIPVAPFPDPVTQTREFLAAALYRSGEPAAGHHLMLWETTLGSGGASELNEEFMARFAQPMEPAAWAAYQAIQIFYDALRGVREGAAADIVAYLEAHTFDVAKGVEAWFGPDDHQLRQPLYVVKIDPEAEWNYTLSARVAVAELAGRVPSVESSSEEAKKALDQLVQPVGARCNP